MKIRENVPISELVTMRIGGDARYVFELENNKLIFRHIDIDFINGEFLELNDTDKRYQRLKEIFSVNETDFENDMLLYKRGEQCD